MNIESFTPVASPPRTPSQNVGQQAARTQVTQLKQSEAKEIENSTQPADDQSKKSTSALSVEDAVKRISDFVAPTQSEISFSIDNVSGVQVVKIMDSQSNEVIRQFPSKEAIEIARALDKLQGLLIKDKA